MGQCCFVALLWSDVRRKPESHPYHLHKDQAFAGQSQEKKMNVSHKKVGLGILALAVGLMGSAALADGKGAKNHGQMGMMPAVFDLSSADANKDGKITKEEFTAYRTAQTAGIDADKDGKLSVSELVAMRIKDAPDQATEMATRMVKSMDVDGDGLLSAAELVSMPMPPDAFDLADTNKDGVIDQAEAEAAMQMMAAKGGKGGKEGKVGKGGKNKTGGTDQNASAGN